MQCTSEWPGGLVVLCLSVEMHAAKQENVPFLFFCLQWLTAVHSGYGWLWLLSDCCSPAAPPAALILALSLCRSASLPLCLCSPLNRPTGVKLLYMA